MKLTTPHLLFCFSLSLMFEMKTIAGCFPLTFSFPREARISSSSCHNKLSYNMMHRDCKAQMSKNPAGFITVICWVLCSDVAYRKSYTMLEKEKLLHLHNPLSSSLQESAVLVLFPVIFSNLGFAAWLCTTIPCAELLTLFKGILSGKKKS